MLSCPVCGKLNERIIPPYSSYNCVCSCDFCGISYAEETQYETNMDEEGDWWDDVSYEIVFRTWEDNEAITKNFNLKKKDYEKWMLKN